MSPFALNSLALVSDVLILLSLISMPKTVSACKNAAAILNNPDPQPMSKKVLPFNESTSNKSLIDSIALSSLSWLSILE